MVNEKLEVCDKRDPRQKYYYDLISIFGNNICREKNIYLHTSKIMSCKGAGNGPKNMSFAQKGPMV